jgi:hypothetical protein
LPAYNKCCRTQTSSANFLLY